MVLSWGQNTVHTYPPAPTPAPGLSGAAPASSFTFGGGAASSSSGLFGGVGATAAAAAPTPLFGGGGGGFFGSSSSTPAPAAFGSTTTTTGGLFGGFSAAASGGGGGGLFGTTVTQPQPIQQAPQIPAHAALRAHLDASARNEHARVCHKMTRLYEAYTTGGTVPPEDEEEEDDMDNNNNNGRRRSRSHCFSTILYNPATAQQLQFAAAVKASVGGGSNTSLATVVGQLEPKPAPLSSHDWRWAWIRNPDPSRYVPLVVTGADALAARALAHPEQATAQWQQGWDPLHTTVTATTRRHARLKAQLATQQVRHAQQVRRLWKILSHVEVARCYHVPTTTAEYEGAQRVQHLLRHVVQQELEPAVTQLLLPPPLRNDTASRWTHRHDDTPSREHQEKWKELLTQHRAQLQTLTERVARDQHDLTLIRDRVLGSEDPQLRQPPQQQAKQYLLR